MPHTKFLLGLLVVLFRIVAVPAPLLAIDEKGSYTDDVPPIEEQGIEALRKKVEELQNRLQSRGDPTPEEPIHAPSLSERDYRDDVAPIDPSDLERLEKLIKELEQRLRALEKKPPEESPRPQGKPSPRLEQLDERVTNIERLLVGTPQKPGIAGMIGGWTPRNGFFLESAQHGFFLRLGGLLQADYRSFPGGQNGTNPGIVPSTFVLQRARINVYGRIFRYFRFMITPDLGNGFRNDVLVNGRVQIFNGFIEWDQFPWLALRMGKFKNPISLEMLQAPQHLSFMERSLVRNLVPNRDIGAMLSGQILRGELEYQLGVFNGAPSANFAEESRAFSTGKELTARAFSTPFINSGPELLRGFGAGVGFSYGSIRNTTGQDPMQTETFSYTFFQYQSSVDGDGDQIRVSPQTYWYWNRLGFLGQYVWTAQQERLFNGPSARLIHDAWSAQLSYFLTDDRATYGRVDPHRPLDFKKPGYWGAWEVAARYSQINLDPLAFSLGMADPTINAQRAKSTTVGVNWYLNFNLRTTVNYVHTDFTGATAAYRAASHEDGLMVRLQLVF
jgi:phosphate-selective porin OprO/OprP